MEGAEHIAEKAKGFPLWAWAVGGGAVLFLVLGRRGGGGSGPSQAAVISGEQALAQRFLAEEQSQRLKQQSALDALDLQRAQQQFRLESLIGNLQEEGLKRQLQIEKGISDQAKRLAGRKGGVKCPSGTAHIDPQTGQVYCRQEQHKGGLLPTLGTLGGIYQQLLGMGVKF